MTDDPQEEVWDGTTERRAGRSEMMEVVMTVVSTLNEVITVLRSEVAALGDQERKGRNRITAFLAVLIVAAVASVVGVGLIYSQGQDIKTVVKYIEDCQKPDSECRKRSDNNLANAVISVSGAVFDATSCVQAVPLNERTNEFVKACRDKYIGVRTK